MESISWYVEEIKNVNIMLQIANEKRGCSSTFGTMFPFDVEYTPAELIRYRDKIKSDFKKFMEIRLKPNT